MVGCHNSEKSISLLCNDWNLRITCICLSRSPKQKPPDNQLKARLRRKQQRSHICRAQKRKKLEDMYSALSKLYNPFSSTYTQMVHGNKTVTLFNISLSDYLFHVLHSQTCVLFSNSKPFRRSLCEDIKGVGVMAMQMASAIKRMGITSPQI